MVGVGGASWRHWRGQHVLPTCRRSVDQSRATTELRVSGACNVASATAAASGGGQPLPAPVCLQWPSMRHGGGCAQQVSSRLACRCSQGHCKGGGGAWIACFSWWARAVHPHCVPISGRLAPVSGEVVACAGVAQLANRILALLAGYSPSRLLAASATPTAGAHRRDARVYVRAYRGPGRPICPRQRVHHSCTRRRCEDDARGEGA